MTTEIDIFHREYAARRELIKKSAQSCPGITKMSKNKADINEVVPVIRLRADCDVLHPEVDILNTEALRLVLGNCDLRSIEVYTGYMPLWHHAADRYGDVTTATSHIKASRIRLKRKSFQKCKRGWPHDAGENPQSLPTFNSALN